MRLRIRSRYGPNRRRALCCLAAAAPYAVRTAAHALPLEPPSFLPADPAALDNPYGRYYSSPRALAQLRPSRTEK